MEAYVYGETQLIYFSDVREHIKADKEIELVLMNVESTSNKNIAANLDYGPGGGSLYSRRDTEDPPGLGPSLTLLQNRNRRATSRTVLQNINFSPLAIDE